MPTLDAICRDDFGGAGPPAPPRSFQWYHLTMGFYGTWLYGDRRGFRTRRHREHVHGDYKNPPPPGKYEQAEARSAASLKQRPVLVNETYRQVVGRALVKRLRQLGAFVLAAAVAARHVHCQLKMPFAMRNDWVAAAKRHVWFEVRAAGWEKKLWAKRKRLAPIRNRSHHYNTFDYILRHVEQNSWVWAWEGVAKARLTSAFQRCFSRQTRELQ